MSPIPYDDLEKFSVLGKIVKSLVNSLSGLIRSLLFLFHVGPKGSPYKALCSVINGKLERFNPHNTFQPSLIFPCKTRDCPSGAPSQRYNASSGSCPTRKY